jgi:hypothetical protein
LAAIFFLENGLEMKGKLAASLMYYLAQARHNGFDPDYKLVSLLMKNGADWNCTANQEYMAPLHFACILGRVDIVRLMIAYKVEPNCVDKSFKLPINYAMEKEGDNFRTIEHELREIKAMVSWRKDLAESTLPSMMEQLTGSEVGTDIVFSN